MIREVIMTGETVELAIEAGCKELGLETHEAQFEIIDMPVKKTLGLFGGNPAKVRVYVESSPAEAAIDYLKSILRAMGAGQVEITHEENESGAVLTIDGDGLGFIIGRHGETLDALQYLSGLVANHVDNNYYRITLNMGNYREKREKTLESLATKMAGKALKYGRNQKLEPMNPYERRIIHTAVQAVEGAKSWSEGEDQNRHVVIGPEAGERPYTPRDRRPGPGGPRGTGGGYRGGPNNRGGRPGGDRRDNPNRDRRPGGDRRFDNHSGRPGTEHRSFDSSSQSSSPSRPKSATETSGGPLYGRIDVKK